MTKKMNVRLINDFSHKKAQRFHFTLSSNFLMHDSACSQFLEVCWTTGSGGGAGSLLNRFLQNASPLGALRPSPP
jgi:hypothetical protein